MTSLPSPGSQMNTSWPDPMIPVSLPRLPSATSAPPPPRTSSSPAPAATVVDSVSVKVPLASSIRTSSSPPPAVTTMRSKVARSKAASATPSPSSSTSTVVGVPALSRRVIVSDSRSPSTSSVPLATWADTAASARSAARPAPAASSAPAASRPAIERRRTRGLNVMVRVTTGSFRGGGPARQDASRDAAIPEALQPSPEGLALGPVLREERDGDPGPGAGRLGHPALADHDPHVRDRPAPRAAAAVREEDEVAGPELGDRRPAARPLPRHRVGRPPAQGVPQPGLGDGPTRPGPSS